MLNEDQRLTCIMRAHEMILKNAADEFEALLEVHNFSTGLSTLIQDYKDAKYALLIELLKRIGVS